MDSLHAETVAGPWCNEDPVASSIFEALSFATPALERFFIRTVADALPAEHRVELVARGVAFIREEAAHSCAHKRFNRQLVGYLGNPPPSARGLERVLARWGGALRLTDRLLMVAALEHFAAVLSRFYLDRGAAWRFDSPEGRALFDWHAREELGHCSVAFDLCMQARPRGGFARLLAICALALAGGTYVSVTAAWILHRKGGRRWRRTLRDLLAAGQRFRGPWSRPCGELLRFAARGYHPEMLFGDAGAMMPDSRVLGSRPS